MPFFLRSYRVRSGYIEPEPIVNDYAHTLKSVVGCFEMVKIGSIVKTKIQFLLMTAVELILMGSCHDRDGLNFKTLTWLSLCMLFVERYFFGVDSSGHSTTKKPGPTRKASAWNRSFPHSPPFEFGPNFMSDVGILHVLRTPGRHPWSCSSCRRTDSCIAVPPRTMRTENCLLMEFCFWTSRKCCVVSTSGGKA